MSDDSHLSRIETMWSVVRRSQKVVDEGLSHTDQTAAQRVKQAQQQLLGRYGNAIRRYLIACLKSTDAADEVYQEFALKFVRGDFRNADAQLGRFRSFLKTTLYRLIVDYFRRAKRNAVVEFSVGDVQDDSPDSGEADDEFIQQWRSELLLRTFSALEQFEKESGRRFHTLMKLRTDNPGIDSNELAKLFSESTDQQVTSANARVMLHRAREKFAGLLIEEVAQTLGDDSIDTIEQELAELNLLVHCRDAIAKLR